MEAPSLELWLREAKSDPAAGKCGMYLVHNGVVRATAKAQVRRGKACPPVDGMEFFCDWEKVDEAVLAARATPGVYYVRVWLNEGMLRVGDDLMLVLVGGDIRPRVTAALQALVEELKTNCVTEREVSAQ